MKTLFFVVALLLAPTIVSAQDLIRAGMYLDHGLVDDAKRDYINIAASDDFYDDDRAKALNALGSIAFSENKIGLAVATWSKLIELYPSSVQADEIKSRLTELSDVVESGSTEAINNVVAESYIGNGDWWSKNKEEVTTIDTSWIPADQVAIGWFDKVISEFPKSSAARVAYIKKFQVVLGWKEPGEYGETYGVMQTRNITDLVTVFNEFAEQFPSDSNLQRLRYTIAQEYWRNKSFNETKEWLNKIVEADAGNGSFYGDLAIWRLKKIDY